jgi:hypothetical protein
MSKFTSSIFCLWRTEQGIILNQRLLQSEIEAHAVSDPITPRYLYQLECQP